MNPDPKHSLPPLVFENPKILILGSLPGEISIARQEYYANLHNRFWTVTAGIFGEKVPDDYDCKKDLLSRHGIALWDVYRYADREGSLDANIGSGEYNDIVSILRQYPSIRVIAVNGGKAMRSFKKYIKSHDLSPYSVRIEYYASTSALSRTSGWTDERLIEQWSGMLR